MPLYRDVRRDDPDGVRHRGPRGCSSPTRSDGSRRETECLRAAGRFLRGGPLDADLDDPFRAVFIRAPAVERVGDGVEVLASHDGQPVLVRQGRLMASSFHPEMTGDPRIHRMFVDLAGRRCPVTRNGRPSSARRAPPTRSARRCGASSCASWRSPRARAAETSMRTRTSRRRSRRLRRARYPTTTSSGRSSAGPASSRARPTRRSSYEGYGPGGVAILVHCLTSNRNRAAQDVRSAFNGFGGKLSEPGAVSWMFEPKGIVIVPTSSAGEDDVFMVAADAGAEDVRSSEETIEVITPPDALKPVRDALEPGAWRSNRAS